MKILLNWINDFICKYFGLSLEVVSPSTIRLKKNEFIISYTESFKRHMYTQSWRQFDKINFHQLNKGDKILLGNALGKAIANNLNISFEEITILESKHA